MTKIVQIKGPNGSGKTTIVKQLLALSSDNHILVNAEGKTVATVMDDLSWIAIGRYPVDSKMGGCDTIGSVAAVKRAILTSMKYRPGYWIVFEGMMISTIKSTFYDYLLCLEHMYAIEPLFVILSTNADACIERISGRGTMKPGLKYDNIRSKAEQVIRHAQEYDPKLVKYIFVDRVIRDAMLLAFLACVQDDDLLRQL